MFKVNRLERRISTEVYKIASKSFAIHYGDGLASKLLQKELSLYEKTNPPSDILVSINGKLNGTKILARNPLTHEEFENGFSCNFGQAIVTWIKKKDGLYVNLTFDENKKSLIRKFRSIQYTHPFENIGQVFHELVLIPTLFFFPEELTIIHGSALESEEKNKAIVISGTGGVGKTALELFLIFEKKLKFLADDITILDKNCYVWPNYAFPKIYGYNVLDDKVIEKKLLQHRGIFDKGQWHIIKKKFSPHRVRRRVNPYVFYNQQVSTGSLLSKLFILFRGKYKDFFIENVSVNEAVEINLEIMKSEYTTFFKHLYWHKINRAIMQTKTMIDADCILHKWSELQKKVLKNCDCYLVKIPLKSKLMELRKWFLFAL